MSAGWDALAAFANTLGTGLLNREKADLAQKLEADREARQEKMDIARENRQLARQDTTPDLGATRYVRNAEGVLMEQIRSGTGKVLEEKAAPQNIIQQYERDETKEKLGLEKALLDMQKTKAEIEYLPQKYDLDRRKNEALIGQYEAYADKAERWTPSAGRTSSRSGSTAGGMARVPLDKSLEQSLLGKRDEDGSVQMDKYDRPVIDPDKKAAFMKSQEYKTIPDANQALEAYMSNEKQTEVLRAEPGIPEYIIQGTREAAVTGKELKEGDLKQFDISKLPAEQQEKARVGLENLQRAKQLIREGKISKEQAKQRLIDNGFPRLAMQIL